MAQDGSTGVPEIVSECVESIATNIKDVESNIRKVLELWDTDVLSELSPLERAHCYLTLANVVITLFTLHLQCRGESLDEDPIQSELERFQLYKNKVEYFIDMNTAKRATAVNTQAATRFIGHSLPDLTAEQRRDLRDIGRGSSFGRRPMNDSGKRKYEEPGKLSVAQEAALFLEKARKELLACKNEDEENPTKNNSQGEESD